METEVKNVIFFASSVGASLCYCYFIASKIPKGIFRFISLMPIFYLFTILPLSFSYLSTTAFFASFTTWLTNFNLLRFAFDLHESPFRNSKSLLQFIILASLPLKINHITHSSSTSSSPKLFPFKLGFQALIFAVLVRIVYDYREKLHPKILLLIYCCLLWLLIEVVRSLVNIVVRFLIGLELQSSSNEPYLATSLQDFWGRRWNLIVNKSLRHTVYEPVRSAFPGRKWASLAGVLATFVVSGLMHELFVCQLSREDPTWEMTSFFVLHGVCVIAEMCAKRALAARKWRLPGFVARSLTVGFMTATAFWLFLPPLIRNGIDVKMIEEYMRVLGFLKTITTQYYGFKN